MEKSSGTLSVLSCNANKIATIMLVSVLKFSKSNFLDELMKGNGFLVYVRGNWHTLKQALNMTLQNEIIRKVNALCSVQGIILSSCFTTCGSLHIWTGKAFAFYKPAIRSSKKSSNLHNYTLLIALPMN